MINLIFADTWNFTFIQYFVSGFWKIHSSLHPLQSAKVPKTNAGEAEVPTGKERMVGMVVVTNDFIDIMDS